jgi:phage antirepressor YoqD-like protein
VPYAGWPDVVTPRDIAKALGISDKALRAWLRKNRDLIHAPNERWELTPADADKIVGAYCAPKR